MRDIKCRLLSQEEFAGWFKGHLRLRRSKVLLVYAFGFAVAPIARPLSSPRLAPLPRVETVDVECRFATKPSFVWQSLWIETPVFRLGDL